MTRTLAIAGREIRAYFLTPSGYIITALFVFALSVVFLLFDFGQGEVASLRSTLGAGTWMLTFIAPAMTMRLISEELRSGTFESLVTTPATETQIIVGKFIGSVAVLLAMFIPSILLVVPLEIYGRPDYGELFCGYLGVFVAGLAYLAVGLFASTLTSLQVIAFLIAMFFWLILGIGTWVLPQVITVHFPSWIGEPLANVLWAISPQARLRDFSIGLIDTSNIVFFVSIAAVFLVGATLSLRARRVA